MSQRQTKSPCHGGCYSHLRLAGVAGASRESRWCDLGESLVQLGKVAGATWASRWCNSGKSLVQLWQVAGATHGSRWCDFGAAQSATVTLPASKPAAFMKVAK